MSEQIAVAILRLQQSMEQVENRLFSLEHQIRSANSSRSSEGQRSSVSLGFPAHVTSVDTGIRDKRGNGSWSPFAGLSPTATVFLVVWPVVAHLLLDRIRSHRSGK